MAENSIHVLISSDGKILFDGQASNVTIPGKNGVFALSKDHIPICTELSNGLVIIDNNKNSFQIPDKGICLFQNNKLAILF